MNTLLHRCLSCESSEIRRAGSDCELDPDSGYRTPVAEQRVTVIVRILRRRRILRLRIQRK